MTHGALMHDAVDDVAVVVQDVATGDQVRAVTLEGAEVAVVTAIEPIPLGHKIALRDVTEDKEVIKYGRAIGRASQPIAQGAHVHTQNVRSIRWETSIDE
jgi:(2R)-sulfolactate sulfo-lyase subunit alpha